MGEFYAWLVEAVSLHGPRAIDALCSEFAQEWKDDSQAIIWPASVRLRIILALARAGAKQAWATERLVELERTPSHDESVGGQIDDLRQRAEAWLTLGDGNTACRQLELILDRTARVGEKDHQLDAWIGVLDRVNRVQPGRAAARIAWFAGAVVSLAETGGPAKYAARELLKAAYCWSPRAAVPLLGWFLGQRSVWHADALFDIVEAAIDLPDPPTDLVVTCLAELAIPIATSSRAALAERLIVGVATREGHDRAVEVAKRILDAVVVYALPSVRPAWRRGVARALDRLGVDLQRAALSHDALGPASDDSAPHVLVLSDATKLDAEEVEREATSVEGLRSLLDREAGTSFWEWAPAVARLIGPSDRHTVHEVAALFEGRPRQGAVILTIGERLLALGDIGGAWSLGTRVLADAEPYDWDRRYAGGHRLAALRFLFRVDAGRARPVAFETLGGDLSNGACSPQAVALNLGEILPMLADDTTMADTWPEVESHVHSLFSGARMPLLDPESLSRPGTEEVPGHALAELIVSHLGHPVSSLAQSAQRACVGLVLRRDPAMIATLDQRLEGPESEIEEALTVLDAACLRRPNSVVTLMERLDGLLRSPNSHIRKTADTILVRLGNTRDCDAPVPVPLSDLFRLSLRPLRPVERAETIGFREISSFEAMPNSLDPAEMVRPFDMLLEGVAHESGLPLANLCQRTYQLMCRLAPPDEWTEQAEVRLRAELEAADLKLGYRRPRPVLARRAVFNVVAELVDAGKLRPETLRRLDPILRFYDPVLVGTGPGPRPDGLRSMEIPEEEADCSAWVQSIDESYDEVVDRIGEHWCVVGEATFLKRLTWHLPVEERRTGLWTVGDPLHGAEETGDEYTFANMTWRLVSEYPDLRVDSSPLPLVLRHRAYTYDSAGVNWLALNPAVGLDLGWRLQEDGLFRWVDDSGRVMAESLWWADGLVGLFISLSR